MSVIQSTSVKVLKSIQKFIKQHVKVVKAVTNRK